MRAIDYLKLKARLIDLGYAEEIDWAENVGPCQNYNIFAYEAMWVILNSGMKNQIARQIEQRIYHALNNNQPISSAFGHNGKVKAIEYILENKKRLFYEYENAEDKVEYLKSLPWIGDITKYHLAKNLGLDVCKPDRHLVRIAGKYNLTPIELCQRLADATGDRIGVVDIVLWRAGNLGII